MWNDDQSADLVFARRLALAGIGIGVAEILAPQQVVSLLGLPRDRDLEGALRVFGVREVAQGVCILSEDALTQTLEIGIWARVVGDALDTALLLYAATKTEAPARFIGVAASVALIGVVDVLSARRISCRRPTVTSAR
jgi:hypothetical protein